MFVKALVSLLLLISAPALLATPQIQHWVTDNGARVYFVAAPELPMVDIQITFDAGSARDGERPGLALLTNGLLSEGAGPWDADAIAARFEGVGAAFSNSAGRDMASLSLRSLTRPELLEQALATLEAIVERPTFPVTAFERERSRLLVAIDRRGQDPGAQAQLAFYRALYGEHPYAHPPGGYRETVEAIERQDLLAFHRRYYVARNAVIAIVGAVDRAQAERLAERLSDELPAGEPAPALPPPPEGGEERRVAIDFPSTQSHILMGQLGVYRGDPDYFPLFVGNHILGGAALVSRIFDEVREKRGLAYSAYSYLVPMRRHGPYLMGLQTRNDQAEEALSVLQQTVARFVADGPTEEELRAAKANLVGGFPLRIDTNRKILGYLSMIGFYGLELDYLDRFTGRIEAVTLEQVRDAFQRRVQPQRMVTVVVGQESGGAPEP